MFRVGVEGKFNSILVVYAYGITSGLITCQRLEIQRIEPVKGLRRGNSDECFNPLLIPPDDVWLKAVLFVGGTPRFK